MSIADFCLPLYSIGPTAPVVGKVLDRGAICRCRPTKQGPIGVVSSDANPYVYHNRDHQRSISNLNIRGMGESATLAINELSREMMAQGREVYRLGLGQSPFPVPEHVTSGTCRPCARERLFAGKGPTRIARGGRRLGSAYRGPGLQQ